MNCRSSSALFIYSRTLHRVIHPSTHLPTVDCGLLGCESCGVVGCASHCLQSSSACAGYLQFNLRSERTEQPDGKSYRNKEKVALKFLFLSYSSFLPILHLIRLLLLLKHSSSSFFWFSSTPHPYVFFLLYTSVFAFLFCSFFNLPSTFSSSCAFSPVSYSIGLFLLSFSSFLFASSLFVLGPPLFLVTFFMLLLLIYISCFLPSPF